MRNIRLHFKCNTYVATAWQLLIALLALWLTRFLFVAVNGESTGVDSVAPMLKLSLYGLRFDIVAVAYFNALFILMRLLPLRYATSRGWLKATGVVYGVCNALLLALSLGDVVYYRFSGTRLRWSGVQEVLADNNAGGIVLQYAAHYWWLVAVFALVVAAMMWLYRRPVIERSRFHGAKAATVRIAALAAGAVLTVFAMRGRAGSGNPLNIADATWGTTEAPQVNVVLNTPFTVLRSIGKNAAVERLTYFTPDELVAIRNSVRKGSGEPMVHKNVMLIIVESGGAAFVDTLNLFDTPEQPSPLRGLMPFTDSIARQSLRVMHMMATGRRSNEGATAILAGFPAFEPLVFMLSPYNAVKFDSAPSLLRRQGYESAFFYGCNHGSFQIDQLAHAAGFERTVDRASYRGKSSDYDGVWGIYDGPMGCEVVRSLGEMHQPWIASWFTISAHSPFSMPDGESTEGYVHRDASPERGLEYTDRALRAFFDAARGEEWYANTIFVITGDHGNRDMGAGARYDTPYIKYHVPFIVYAPDGSISPREIDGRAFTQFDIGPTLLDLLKYPDDYVALGRSALRDEEGYGLSFIDNRYMISSATRVVMTDEKASKAVAVYDAVADPELRRPLGSGELNSVPTQAMLKWAQAFLTDYSNRINDSRLTLDEKK